MEDFAVRLVEDMIDRVSGPMNLRLILQPIMASVFAVISGIKDAKAGRNAYFISIFRHADERVEMVKNGWKAVGKVFIVAIVLDVVYQFYVQRWVYPGEALLTAIILAILPYVAVRGIVNRIFTKAAARNYRL